MSPLSDGKHTARTIGVLYPGELGSRLGLVLGRHGHRVVTTLSDRSVRTQRLAAEADIEALPSLGDVVDRADLVLSVVPPAAAATTAEKFLQLARAKAVRPLYVDANAISPVTAGGIAERFASAGVPFVDASIHGLAGRLPTSGKIYLSGGHVEQVAAVLAPLFAIEVLGHQPGAASAMKMLIGGLNKGVVALYFELSRLANRLGMTEQLLSVYRASYPGVMELVDRLLPSYPEHACRRADEMEELQKTALAAGLQPRMAKAAAETIRALAEDPNCRSLSKECEIHLSAEPIASELSAMPSCSGA